MSGYGNAEIPNLFLILVTTYKLNGKSGIQFFFFYIYKFTAHLFRSFWCIFINHVLYRYYVHMIIMQNELQQCGFACFDISQMKQFIMKVILKTSEAEILAHLQVQHQQNHFLKLTTLCR